MTSNNQAATGGVPLSNYQGVYDTSLGLMGQNKAFSPLIVYDDGTIDVAGVEIPLQYDPATSTVTIPPCQMGEASTQGGTLVFSSIQNTNMCQFHGTINTGNGNTAGFSGSTQFVFANPTLANAVDATQAFDNNDGIQLQALNGNWVGVGNNNTIVAASNQVPGFWFNVNFAYSGITINYDGAYWSGGGSGTTQLFTSTNIDNAFIFKPLMTLNGKFILQNITDSRFVIVQNDGSLALASENVLMPLLEFDIKVNPVPQSQLLERWGIAEVAITPCQMDIASLCWQTTGGLFLALGIGPYMAGSTDPVKIGVMGILKTNTNVWAKVTAAIDFLKANPRATAGTIAGLATGILSAAWTAGLLWKLVKFVLTQAGWWVLFRLLAHIIETIFLPELEVAQLLASFLVWAGGVVNTAIRISIDCVNSVRLPSPTPQLRWQMA
jgi:hypothetical protein